MSVSVHGGVKPICVCMCVVCVQYFLNDIFMIIMVLCQCPIIKNMYYLLAFVNY